MVCRDDVLESRKNMQPFDYNESNKKNTIARMNPLRANHKVEPLFEHH